MRRTVFNLLAACSLTVALLILSAAVAAGVSARGPGAPLQLIADNNWELSVSDNYVRLSRFVDVSAPAPPGRRWGSDMAEFLYGTFPFKRTNVYRDGFGAKVSNAIAVPLALVLPVEWLRRTLNQRRARNRVGFPIDAEALSSSESNSPSAAP